MQKQKSTFLYFLYSAGVLLGITLSVLAIWADYEATSYGFFRRAQTPFKGLSCPILMTADETQTVQIRLTNSTEKKISPSIRTEISTKLVIDEKLEFFELEPGESLLVERTIGSENIDLGQFIFVKASVFSSHPLPDQENTCGVFILPMRGSGTVILIIASMIGLFSTIISLFLLNKSNTLKKLVYPFVFIAVAVALAMTFGFLGLWIQGVLMLVLGILTIFIAFNIMAQ
jgi:hypothetical protein